ncbi:hypothetical protein [Hymenobacter sp. BRD67]|uniref:hypothetical protein n=1 Tax=Hymenobacter sp. BRD67 TaxID=2675877 RepID=UPI0020B86C13|nr:hypothetical protein [Hymenobacter sp. BRD67]
MKNTSLLLTVGLLSLTTATNLWAQATATGTAAPVLPLYSGSIPDSKPSQVQETSVTESVGVRISNVIQPTLTVFIPDRAKATGTSVIICPGGVTGGWPSTTRATTWPSASTSWAWRPLC